MRVDWIEFLQFFRIRQGFVAGACAVYHDGAEAALPHLERAIQWHSAFEARRAARAA
jgi:hypothetical protein